MDNPEQPPQPAKPPPQLPNADIASYGEDGIEWFRAPVNHPDLPMEDWDWYAWKNGDLIEDYVNAPTLENTICEMWDRFLDTKDEQYKHAANVLSQHLIT